MSGAGGTRSEPSPRRGRTSAAVGTLFAAVAAVTIGGAGLVTTSAGAQSDATSVVIVHALPGVTADLYVDGEILIAGFEPGDVQDVTPLAGQTLRNIDGRQAGSDSVFFGPVEEFSVPDAGDVSIAVHLDADGDPTVTSFPNAATPLAEGEGRLTIRHVAAARPIGLDVGGSPVISDLASGREGSVDLPAGEVADAWVTIDGSRLVRLPPITVEAGRQQIAYLGGDVDLGLELFRQTIDVPPAATAASPPAEGADEGDEGESGDEAADDAADDTGAAPPERSSDGTVQPTRVDTGMLPGGSVTSDLVLVSIGLAMLAVAGALLVERPSRPRGAFARHVGGRSGRR